MIARIVLEIHIRLDRRASKQVTRDGYIPIRAPIYINFRSPKKVSIDADVLTATCSAPMVSLMSEFVIFVGPRASTVTTATTKARGREGDGERKEEG